jgi:putative SbcD/Mre11-related phosphoesterase
MDKTQTEIFPGIWADCRRALFIESEALLAVADLHLGYAWAHRFNGQLMPVDGGHPGAQLLGQMAAEYHAKKLVILGDIMHQAVPVPQAVDEVRGLLTLRDQLELILLAGNHDRRLETVLAKLAPGFELRKEYSMRGMRLLHGDQPLCNLEAGERFIIGHEHPAIILGDGVSTSAKFPCFLYGEEGIILPAFSPWAAGSPINSRRFMAPCAQQAKFQTALAILGKKLLPVPFEGIPRLC